MAQIAPLKIKPRPGTYSRTADTVEQILNATLRILMSEGYAALTMRRVAAECGLRVGNVTYHFASKEALLKELLDAVLDAYEERSRRVVEDAGVGDLVKLKTGIFNTLRDVQSYQTTYLFPELWSMANHDQELADRLQEFYRLARRPTEIMLRRLNPALSEDDARTVAIFISSFIEGTTIFAGYGKPHAAIMPDLAALALQTVIEVATTITPDQLHALRKPWAAEPSVLRIPSFLLDEANRR